MFNKKTKLFYTRLCTTKTPIKKLKCVKANVKINPYIEPYKDIVLKTIFKDIHDYIELLEYINNLDLDLRIEIPSVDFDNIYNIRTVDFFTDNGKMLRDTNSILIDYIDNLILLQEWYNSNYKNVTQPVVYRNTMLVKPYLTNSYDIIDTIVNVVNEERKYKNK